MAHVIVLDSLNEDIFVCGLCKSVFNSLTIFVDHKRQSCVNDVIVTNISNGSNSQLDSGVTNIILHDEKLSQSYTHSNTLEVPTQGITNNEEILTCKLCTKKFKNNKTLLTHMKAHIEKFRHQCAICGRCFAQNSHLQRHIEAHKVWPEGISETTAKSSDVEIFSYTCSYCNNILTNYSQFRVHLKTHVNFKKFKCIQSKCVDFFDTTDDLIEHVTNVHPSPVYCCHICSVNFNSLETIADHLQGHQHETDNRFPKKQYKCSFCDAVFKRFDKLSLHMVTESHNKCCVHCNKTFASDKRLRIHLQIHGKSKPFKCNLCNNSFSLKKYLITHMLTHGQKQFKCDICENMFKRQDLLQRHMNMHQLKKIFKCPFRESLGCKKEFSRKDKLQLHAKCHAKNIPYQRNIQLFLNLTDDKSTDKEANVEKTILIQA